MHENHEEKLNQLRAEIAAFVHERATIKESLRRVQGALRHETRQLLPDSAKSHTATKADQTSATPPPASNVDKEGGLSDTEPSSRKRPRPEQEQSQEPSNSKVSASEPSSTAADKKGAIPAATVTEEVDPPVKRPRLELDDSAKQRTAKLFGHLMGHLKKAKARLESERDTKAAELQQETARRVEEKLEREKTALAEARVQTLKETEAALREKLRRVQWELSCRETLCLRYQLEIHYTIMQGFIKTTAEPTLFWVPRVHNEETRNLQKETAAQIEKKIKSLHEQLRAVPYEEWITLTKQQV